MTSKNISSASIMRFGLFLMILAGIIELILLIPGVPQAEWAVILSKCLILGSMCVEFVAMVIIYITKEK